MSGPYVALSCFPPFIYRREPRPGAAWKKTARGGDASVHEDACIAGVVRAVAGGTTRTRRTARHWHGWGDRPVGATGPKDWGNAGVRNATRAGSPGASRTRSHTS